MSLSKLHGALPLAGGLIVIAAPVWAADMHIKVVDGHNKLLADAVVTLNGVENTSLLTSATMNQRARRYIKSMLLNIAHDPRIVMHFRNVDIQRLRDKLIEQVR
jgi:hypothetical protein